MLPRMGYSHAMVVCLISRTADPARGNLSEPCIQVDLRWRHRSVDSCDSPPRQRPRRERDRCHPQTNRSAAAGDLSGGGDGDSRRCWFCLACLVRLLRSGRDRTDRRVAALLTLPRLKRVGFWLPRGVPFGLSSSRSYRLSTRKHGLRMGVRGDGLAQRDELVIRAIALHRVDSRIAPDEVGDVSRDVLRPMTRIEMVKTRGDAWLNRFPCVETSESRLLQLCKEDIPLISGYGVFLRNIRNVMLTAVPTRLVAWLTTIGANAFGAPSFSVQGGVLSPSGIPLTPTFAAHLRLIVAWLTTVEAQASGVIRPPFCIGLYCISLRMTGCTRTTKDSRSRLTARCTAVFAQARIYPCLLCFVVRHPILHGRKSTDNRLPVQYIIICLWRLVFLALRGIRVATIAVGALLFHALDCSTYRVNVLNGFSTSATHGCRNVRRGTRPEYASSGSDAVEPHCIPFLLPVPHPAWSACCPEGARFLLRNTPTIPPERSD